MKTKKISNIKYQFSKNLYKALIAPVIIIVLAVVFALTLGVNKGIDLKGGIIVSVVAGTHTDLDDNNTYNQFKSRVDGVLKDNNAKGQVYTVELNNNTQEYALVVKFAYDKSDKDEFIASVKNGLIEEFYATTPVEDVENNNYVLVATFGSSLDNTVVITTVLATVVCALLMCIYILIRMGLNAGVISLLSAVFNNAFAIALIVVARIQVTYASIAVIPFVTIISILATMIYLKKTKDLLYASEQYGKKDNYEVADDAVKQSLNKQVLFAGVSAGALLILGAFNILNSVLFVSLAMFTAVACMLYTNLLLVPGVFARTYVRKYKKAKQVKKTENKDNLTEERVMKETDLDNLVSN